MSFILELIKTEREIEVSEEFLDLVNLAETEYKQLLAELDNLRIFSGRFLKDNVDVGKINIELQIKLDELRNIADDMAEAISGGSAAEMVASMQNYYAAVKK